ncbi:MAG: hypothetical protein ABIO35_05915 [Nitrobacter sp.]|jgi:hypothetical protein
MTKSKTNDLADQIRVLDDGELTAVSGGYIDNCIPRQTVTGIVVNSDWTFKDVFAKPTLGTYH